MYGVMHTHIEPLPVPLHRNCWPRGSPTLEAVGANLDLCYRRYATFRALETSFTPYETTSAVVACSWSKISRDAYFPAVLMSG
jgi:hypothetical protein